MLPRASRLRSPGDFSTTIRRGVRVGRPTLVLHASPGAPTASGRVGLVVGKAVGNAVVRNRVKRRLRHLAAERLAAHPLGVDVVLRALPRSGTHPAELPGDLARAWDVARTKLARRTDAVASS